MTDDADDDVLAPGTIIDNLPHLIERLRSHDANGSFAAADLLEAAHRILIAPAGREVFGLRLANPDMLRLVALRMHTD